MSKFQFKKMHFKQPTNNFFNRKHDYAEDDIILKKICYLDDSPIKEF